MFSLRTPSRAHRSCISVSKVLERLIFNYIYPYLSSKHFGFIPDRSCLQQLLSSLFIIFQNYSAHNQTDITFLDFCKAFDTFPHRPLLSIKLYGMGIAGDLFSWFRSYLSCRSQSVCIDDTISSKLQCTSRIRGTTR